MSTKETPKRKGRPLLLAAVGVAFVSYVQCEPKQQEPVGNLVAPPPQVEDAGAPIDQPVGNLAAPVPIEAAAPEVPPPPAVDAGKPKDAGAKRDAASVDPVPTHHPVGNLRPPG